MSHIPVLVKDKKWGFARAHAYEIVIKRSIGFIVAIYPLD
jgi:hypothetical protein